jgi:hypothetical protein
MQQTWPLLLFPSVRVIRVLVSESSTWRKGEGVATEIAASTFALDSSEGVSVFLVRSPEEETHAAAAHVLKRGASVSDPAYVLRIRLWDLISHRIAVQATGGDTGVSGVDRWHRDLRAPLDHYGALTRSLLDARLLGADNVREIPGRLLARQFERFVALDEKKQITSKAKKLAQDRLDNFQRRQQKKG